MKQLSVSLSVSSFRSVFQHSEEAIVPSEGVLEDVNAALLIIPSATITESNHLIYTMAAVMLGCKVNSLKEH